MIEKRQVVILSLFIVCWACCNVFAREIVVQPGPEDGIDVVVTSVFYGGSLENTGYVGQVEVGGWADYYYGLLRFDINSLPADFTSAKIYLYNFGIEGKYTNMYLDKINATWDETTLWVNQPVSTYIATMPAPTGIGWYEIDITDLYREWKTGTTQNYGIKLRPTNNSNKFNLFYSSDYIDDPSLRPKLVVETQNESMALSINITGSGSGFVTIKPANVNCSSNCTENFNSGTVVTIIPVADSGSTFSGWSGSNCSGVGVCQVTMDAAKSVNAEFIIDKGDKMLLTLMPWLGLNKVRLIKTIWSQSEQYKYSYDTNESPCMASPYDSGPKDYFVGCSTVAVGQLINFYFQKGYRVGWLERFLENATVYPRFGDLVGFYFYNSCDFPGYTTLQHYPNSIDERYSDEGINLRRFLWLVALGLDSHFKGDTYVNSAVFSWTGIHQTYPEKIKSLLRDRFRFNPNINYTIELPNLTAEKDFIITSIKQKQPVLTAIWSGENGHMVLIDNYRIDQNENLEVQINWGWGNTKGENDVWYPTSGPIIPAGYTSQWSKFIVFRNTTPINYP